MSGRRGTVRERLLSRLIIDPETGCLLWIGATAGLGYGQIMIDGRQQYVHRVMYEMFVAPIPAGLTIDHLCRVRLCGNPGHLEAVTQRVNILRSDGRAARAARKTHCDSGHEFDLINTYFGPSGRRTCRTCARERYRVKH